MPLSSLIAMVRKDLLVFFSDRRAVIMTFIAPIAIASFFGSIFSGGGRERARVAVAVVDQDRTALSRRIAAVLGQEQTMSVTTPDADSARAQVRDGRVSVAVIIDQGFGERARLAFFTGRNRPALQFLYDPSRAMELAFVRGVVTERTMSVVSQDVFGSQTVDDLNAVVNSAPMEMSAVPRCATSPPRCRSCWHRTAAVATRRSVSDCRTSCVTRRSRRSRM